MKKGMKALAVLLCITALAAGCGRSGDSGTSTVKPSQTTDGAEKTEKEETEKNEGEPAEAKTEVTIGFSSEGDSFDPCTGFGYTGSPLYSSLVKVNGDDQLENDLATEYTVNDDCLLYTSRCV